MEEKIEKVFIGTYTQLLSFVNGRAEGIYVYEFNTTTGKLQYHSTILINGNNPSYLSFESSLQLLLTVSEEEPRGKIFAYKITESGAELKSEVESEGGAPCYITLNTSKDKVITANYVDGSFISYDFDKLNYTFSNKTLIQHDNITSFKEDENEEISAKFPHYLRQTSSHCHHILCIQKGDVEYVFVCDLGKDSVLVYQLNSNSNQFQSISSLNLAKGSGPRHIAYNSLYNQIYVLNELSGTLTSFQISFDDNQFKVLNSFDTPTLPNDIKWELNYSGAAIRISPSFNYLFVSIREHNSISVFKTNQKINEIKLVQNEQSGGKVPRDINIHPSGKWLIAANQESYNLAVFTITESDQVNHNSILSYHSSVECLTPVCISFEN